MLHSTRTVLAISWLPRCPGGERLNTSGLLLLPPPFAPSPSFDHLTPFDKMEWVNAIDSRAQGGWIEAPLFDSNESLSSSFLRVLRIIADLL